MQINDLVNFKIDRLSYDGGRGVGRIDNFVVFVADTAPSELVEAKITLIKKNYAEAELVRVVEPSPERRGAPCPVFGKCGGCKWQHISYAEQIRQKESFLRRALRNQGDYQFEFLPGASEFRYRNRIQLQVDAARQFGFFARKSRTLVPIKDCLIAEPELLQNFKLPAKSGRKIEVAKSGDGQVVIRDLDEEESVFTQVNSAQNLALRQTVVKFFGELANAPVKILDLYCGDGNLSFALLEHFADLQLLGVEFSHDAVERAKSNVAHNPLRSEFVRGDTLKFLKRYNPAQPISMLVDPPRAGLGPEVCAEILRLMPDHIVYVSCNLSTLERDLKALSRGYRMVRATGIDMFAQTEHVETVCLLVAQDEVL